MAPNTGRDQAGRGTPSPLERLARLLLGRPLPNRESPSREIGTLEGVPALGLDGISSSAYGPEAALGILVAAGTAGLGYFNSIMFVILALLGTLFLSYWQTIEAYPRSGGAYTVAKENLGVNASLLAAAAIMIDYVLNVAVGISAGVAALVSAVPALHPYTLLLCLGILALLMLANLRGIMEAGRLFAVPTYLFVGSFFIILFLGFYSVLTSSGHPRALVPPPAPPHAAEAVGIWLLLRAFASGCTAMTGVEAVSNGVTTFREPRVTLARRTLAIIVITLGLLLAGIAYLATAYGIMAMDQSQPGYQSVLSQLAGAVVGRGVFYYIALASALCILCLSADTSFVAFPQLCRLVAQDRFLPRPFATVGRRLVFSVGILYLTGTAGLLLIVFNGITERLIPLFAIGAFLTFTISQTGMVMHWWRELPRRRSRKWHPIWTHLGINALGASVTAIALTVIVAAKFSEGAWITIIAIPGVILLLKVIRRYYDEVGARLREEGPLQFRSAKPPVILVAMHEWNRLADRALSLALELSPDVFAVHLTALDGPDAGEEERKLRQRWADDVEKPLLAAHHPRPPQLIFLSAPYRRLRAPLLKLTRKLEEDYLNRTIAVLIPQLVRRHWWEHLLHSRRAERLRSALLEYGGSRVVVIVVPWHLAEPKIEEAMTEEEVAEPFRVRSNSGSRRQRVGRSET
jgi:amino acid transporter